MACQPGYKEDASGNCILETIDTQDITCYDGSLASSYDQCPDIGTAWDPAEGIGIGGGEEGGLGEDVMGDPWIAPEWWDDPTTPEDEYAKYIYNLYGGAEATTYETAEDFWAAYGPEGEDLFPSWSESGYAAKYENVLDQLGILNTSIRLASEDFNLGLDSLHTRTEATLETALTQKENIGMGMESQFIGTGGVVSGRNIEGAKEASTNITQALGLEFRGIDIDRELLQTSYEGELVNIEDRKLDYENMLIGIEDDFEKHLISLKETMTIKFPEELTTSEIAETCFEAGGSYGREGGNCYLPEDATECSSCEGPCWRNDAGDGEINCGRIEYVFECNDDNECPEGICIEGKCESAAIPGEFALEECIISPRCCTNNVWDESKCEKSSKTECSTEADCPGCGDGYFSICTEHGSCECREENLYPNPFD